VVHRDVSPGNVLISFEGEVKLCDFGIARATDACDDLVREAIAGKAAYMSPEHARGQSLDPRADVFAASILFWEMLAGRRMRRAMPGAEDLLAVAREARVPALPDRGMPDHARIAGIIAKGLSVDAADRYPSAQAMAREVDEYAMAHSLRASPLRLGAFLMEHFGTEIVDTSAPRSSTRAVRASGLPLRLNQVARATARRPRT
jgi:serine/threonine-protein kinase